VDGVTVTLERAYADANRIVVGFTIKGLNGQRYDARHLTLTDAAGTVFSGMHGYGVTGQSHILKVSLPPGEGAYVLAFDAAPVEGAPAELDLRLVMEVVEALPPDAFKLPPTPDSPPAEPPDSMVMEALPAPEGAIVGTFAFDFSVPFIPGRVAEVNQTVEAAGVAVRLERVVVTPSETRAILCFERPTGEPREWMPITTLDAGDKQDLSGIVKPLMGATWYVLSGRLRFKPDGSINAVDETEQEGCYCYSFLASLQDQRGEWTLTVTELVGEDIDRLESQILRQADSAVVSVDAAEAAEFQTRLAGPWVFRFRVP